MKTLIIALVIGACAGLIGALCGVGGGIVMVPAFILGLGMAEKKAIATSMAIIVFTAISATLNNSRQPDLIDWKIVGLAAIGASLAAWFGADYMKTLSNDSLRKIFGIVLIAFGIRALF